MPVELDTPDSLEYVFHPVTSGSVCFKVKAANDAHIALTTGPSEAEPIVEVFIGGWQNTKSVIRVNRAKPDKVEVETPDILSADELRGFWVRWNEGLIEAGKEGEDAPFLSWQNPEPFPITHYGLCTGWGASGSWVVEGREELLTADKLEYNFRPVAVGALEIDVRAPSNAHIALTTGPLETELMYEFIIGGWENTASTIRYNRTKPDKAEVKLPNVVTADAYQRFVVQWDNGLLSVRGPNGGTELLSWKDDSGPIPISHFGVRTAWGASGSWRVRTFDPRTRRGGAASISVAPGITPGWAIPGAQAVAVGWAVPPDAPVASGSPTWVDASNGEVPPNAVSGGLDHGDEEIYIARAQHEGALIPGKLKPSHSVTYVAWGGAEHGKDTYQVLCGITPTWVPASGGEVPPNALPGGETEDGEPLFVGRAQHDGTMTVGKVQASHSVCYIPYGGQEVACAEYEVLVTQ